MIATFLKVNVWGPSDFKYLVDAMRSFIPKAAMVHTHSFGPSPGSDGVSIPNPMMFTDLIVLIDDEVVKISAILLRPNSSEASQLNNENRPLLNARELDLEERRDQFSEALLPRSQNNEFDLAVKPGDISVIYVCELPEIMGKFDPQKAVALGLRPGPKYRDLQLGNSVKSDRQNIMVGLNVMSFILFIYVFRFMFLNLLYRFTLATYWVLLFRVLSYSLLTAKHRLICKSCCLHCFLVIIMEMCQATHQGFPKL